MIFIPAFYDEYRKYCLYDSRHAGLNVLPEWCRQALGKGTAYPTVLMGGPRGCIGFFFGAGNLLARAVVEYSAVGELWSYGEMPDELAELCRAVDAEETTLGAPWRQAMDWILTHPDDLPHDCRRWVDLAVRLETQAMAQEKSHGAH